MTINQNIAAGSTTARDVDNQMDELLNEAKRINQEIDEVNVKASADMDAIEAKVDETASKAEQTFLELDQLEKEAGDELDKIALEQAEDLANE